jgi:16S rRNA (guanine527-N7)-methyltransferase
MNAEAAERLAAYEDLVTAWAPRFDLVAPGDVPRFRTRHIDDCLRLVPLLDSLGEGPAADVGSGAGLPGIVLAIAEPDRPWHLLEPRQKRAAFLEETARELGLGHVSVFPVTAQQAALQEDLSGVHVFAVARAVAPPQSSLDLLKPLLAPAGTAAVFVGKTGQVPIEAKEWQAGIAIFRPRSP